MPNPTVHPIIPELLALLQKHGASITYTRHDDGLHVTAGDQEVFAGWMDAEDGWRELRAAAGDAAPVPGVSP